MKPMYNPAAFAENRAEVLHSFLRAHPFGTLVTNGPDGPEASHVPFFWDAEAGLLRCHMARANPHGRLLTSGARVLAVFTGPHHYITPNWYASKQEHGKVVPTWNYTAVHASGSARLFEDAPSLLRHLHELTDSQEAGSSHPWSVADAPPEFIEGQMKAIVGIEIAVERLEGKWKLNQNRPAADRDGVIAGLETLGSPDSREVARLMRDRRPQRDRD
ncbi:MAG TPA: FMN-binding negative transcriptional regulator [Bryobacteraceae bacterium]|jgi:transcriptional regulator